MVVSCLAKTISSTPELGAASAQVYSGVVAGLVIISLTTVFHPVSGAHINPAISLAMLLIRRVSPVRAIGHVLAQCGGAIAGASVVLGLYGATEHFPTITVTNFGLEFLLTFMIVLVYLRVTDDLYTTVHLDPAMPIGLAYMAALVAYRGAVNPAVALGQAFVVSNFTHHWVFWVGPVLGGSCAALCHEYIFNEQKDIQVALKTMKKEKEEDEEDKSEKHIKCGNTIHFKEDNEEIPATPPLPWSVRKPKRSYSSELIHFAQHDLERDSYEEEEFIISGRYKGEGFKQPNYEQRTRPAQRQNSQDQNPQSHSRTNPQKQSLKTRRSSSKNEQGYQNSSVQNKHGTRKHCLDY